MGLGLDAIKLLQFAVNFVVQAVDFAAASNGNAAISSPTFPTLQLTAEQILNAG
jgi:hypothetical protein